MNELHTVNGEDPGTEKTDEPLYTLEQAEQILREKVCAEHGHGKDGWAMTLVDGGIPIGVGCKMCKAQWVIPPAGRGLELMAQMEPVEPEEM